MSTHRYLVATAAASAIVVCLFGADSLHAKRRHGVSASARSIDFDALAKTLNSKGNTLNLDPADLPAIPSALPGYEHPSAVWLPGNHDLVQEVVKCADKSCTPRVIRLVRKGEKLDPEARIELLPLPQGLAGLQFLPLGLLDVDGDKKAELLVRYRILGPPRPGIGSASSEMLAILRTPELTLALLHELGQSGREGIEPDCKYDVSQLALSGDKRLALRFVRTCVCPKPASHCQPGPAPAEEYVAGTAGRFVRRH